MHSTRVGVPIKAEEFTLGESEPKEAALDMVSGVDS